jgi:hypothetical protein
MRKKLFGAKDECRVAHKFSCVARKKFKSSLSDALDRPFVSNHLPAIHFNTHASAVLMSFPPAVAPRPSYPNERPNLLDFEFVQDYVLCTKLYEMQ